MSFLIPEFITTTVIQNKLLFLSKNPDHLNFMLSALSKNKSVRDIVGPDYIKKCVDYIQNNRINIRPAHEADMTKLPAISVLYYQDESQQFIGDYGSQQESEHINEYEPETICEFDVTAYETNTLTFVQGQGTYDAIWPNLFAKNGNFVSRITNISNTDMQLVDNVPSGTPFRNWQAITSENKKLYEIHASMDTTKVNVSLTTAGDYALHRLLVVLLRYCLKASRLDFENSGMQTPSFSQQPPILIDSEQLIWQTPFIISARITDYWIFNEQIVNNSPKIDLVITPERMQF